MMGAKAQTIMGGNVTVSDLAVSRSEDKLFVSMDIDVSALSVKSNREVILTPRLSGEGNEVELTFGDDSWSQPLLSSSTQWLVYG